MRDPIASSLDASASAATTLFTHCLSIDLAMREYGWPRGAHPHHTDVTVIRKTPQVMTPDVRAEMNRFRVADLFSGGGGMSFGFKANTAFEVVGAADAEVGKPSSPKGSLSCNETYAANIGVEPLSVDLGTSSPAELRRGWGLEGALDVLLACPPCTGFSRAMPANHLVDDARNSLVTRVSAFVEEFQPQIVMMENARELISGNFNHHFKALRAALEGLGYDVCGQTHLLSEFGLPQDRERALVIAVRAPRVLRTLSDLWDGVQVNPSATTVRRAISHLPAVRAGETDPNDPQHVAPGFARKRSLRRIQAIPPDGGSWRHLWDDPETRGLLTKSMARHAKTGRWGNHPDVYGRMSWDRPAPTIKRECAHIGNGRYAHPEQHRLATVREMALLNGFPASYQFRGSVANRYRHIGDAVPPMISFQLSRLAEWILTGDRPTGQSIILPETNLTKADLTAAAATTASR